MHSAVLLQKSIRFFDGAFGTECIRRGLPAGAPPELWNLEFPEIVRDIHREYIHAGAQVITTNTFGGNRFRLKSHALDHRLLEINRRGVELAQEAVQGDVLVAGSIGPLGEMLEPFGTLTATAAREAYREQAEILAGVDLLLIETMISLSEGLLALEAVADTGVETVGITFSFENTDTGPRTPFGETPVEVIQALERNGAHIAGANCGEGFETMLLVASEMKSAAGIPLLIQSNAGLPVYREGQTVYPEYPESFAAFAASLADLGVEFLGGCCGTTPAHMKRGYTAYRLFHGAGGSISHPLPDAP